MCCACFFGSIHYWSFVALNLRNGTADAKVRVGDRLCLVGQPPQQNQDWPKKNPGANEEAHSTQKGGQRYGGGALTEGRRQRKEAGRKGRDERKRATGGGQGWREAKLGASPTGNPRFG